MMESFEMVCCNVCVVSCEVLWYTVQCILYFMLDKWVLVCKYLFESYNLRHWDARLIKQCLVVMSHILIVIVYSWLEPFFLNFMPTKNKRGKQQCIVFQWISTIHNHHYSYYCNFPLHSTNATQESIVYSSME